LVTCSVVEFGLVIARFRTPVTPGASAWSSVPAMVNGVPPCAALTVSFAVAVAVLLPDVPVMVSV
jgi:hypothetical protein